VKDGAGRRLIKAAALGLFYVDLGVSRGLAWLRGDRPHRLAGQCRGSAECCEEPGIAVSRAVWHVPSLRRLYVWWQETVNGFVLSGELRQGRVLLFRCTHFDWESRRCDSYESRPGMCRDYPRVLLSQPAPRMLPGCGYRPLARNAERLARALEARKLDPQTLARLKRELYLE
jgi:Fe-S-cluster containining protein